MALIGKTEGLYYLAALGTPSQVEEVANWYNNLPGQKYTLPERLAPEGQRTYRVQETLNLFLVPQPDGRATALAKLLLRPLALYDDDNDE